MKKFVSFVLTAAISASMTALPCLTAADDTAADSEASIGDSRLILGVVTPAPYTLDILNIDDASDTDSSEDEDDSADTDDVWDADDTDEDSDTDSSDCDDEDDDSEDFDLYDDETYNDDGTVTVALTVVPSYLDIYYTLDGTEPDSSSTKYKKPFTVDRDTPVSAYARLDEDNWIVLELDLNPDEEYEDDEDDTEYDEEYDEEDEEYNIDEDDGSEDSGGSSLTCSAWAEAEIQEALDNGLIPEPMQDEDLTKVITREKFTAAAVYLYEKLSGTYVDIENADITSTPFTDCYYRESDYLDYVSAAYGLGLIDGVTDTEFAPDSAISRQDLAVMMGRVVKKCMYSGWSIAKDGQYPLDASGAKAFADDSDISDYAKESVYFMANNEIILGVDDTHFAPRNVTDLQKATGYATSTKEQAIIIALRCYSKLDGI